MEPRLALTQSESVDANLRRMIAIREESIGAGSSALIVLHSPHGGGSEPLIKGWRRHLMEERLQVFEGSCNGGGSYRPLREIVGRYLRVLDGIGGLDEEVTALAAQVSASLGLPTVAGLTQSRATKEASGLDQLRFFDVLGRLMIALSKRMPGVVIVHQLELADSATRAALDYLLKNVFTDPVDRYAPAGRAAGFQGTVVVSASEVDDNLSALEDDLRDRARAHWISLRDLEEEAIRGFLLSDEVVARLTQASSGSVEALADLLGSLPGKIEDLYLRRLERLDRADRRVIQALAVLGAPAKPDFLLRVVDDADVSPSLSALADQRMIVRHVARGELLVSLPSEANSVVVYDQMTPERKELLHGRVAAMLEERTRLGEPTDIGEIARHYLHSNVVEKAFHYAIEAAERLHISFAYERARTLLELLLPRLSDDVRRAAVLERLVELCSAVNAHDAALAHSRAHLEVSDRSWHAGILRKQAEILLGTGSYDAALERIDAARTLANDQMEEEVARLEILRLLSTEAECHYGRGQYEDAQDAAQRGLELASDVTEVAGRRQAIHLTNTLGKVHLFLGKYDLATEEFASNRSKAQELSWPEEEVRALFNLGTIALQERSYEQAEGVFQECLDFGTQTANPITRAFLKLNLAVVFQKTRRYGQALDAYLDGLATFQQSGNDLQLAVTAMNLASLYETIGQFERARELVHLSIEITSKREMLYFQGRSLYILGSIDLIARDWAAATRSLEKAAEVLGQTGSTTFTALIHIGLARAAHGAGNKALRDDHLAQVVLEGDDSDMVDTRAEADLRTGYFALDDGDVAAAIPLLQSALVSFERLDRAERVWVTRLYLGLAVAAEGDHSRARSLLLSAVELTREIAVALPENLRSTYRDAGSRRMLREALDALEAGRTPRLHEGVLADVEVASVSETEQAEWRAKYEFIVGDDPRLLQIFRMIDRISGSDSTALIQGASGTGKELIAEAIHRYSPRNTGPFIKVNCAAFVETLLLSELFGHEKGAFTGAMARKKGRFELAQGGTLFLDEIGDISSNTQVALLRVLQERSFERVGGSETVLADVRLICATNRNLEEMVRDGSFRLDLYYRLKGVVLELPPLSERREDIPLLIHHFCRQFATASGHIKSFSRDAMGFLVRYSWPGNIRELQNFVRSSLLFVEGQRIELPDVRQFDDFFADGGFIESTPAFVANYEARPRDEPARRAPEAAASRAGATLFEGTDGTPEEQIADWALQAGIGLHDLKRKLEVELIRKALVETGANITQAARKLDMTRPRLSQIVNATPELHQLREKLAK